MSERLLLHELPYSDARVPMRGLLERNSDSFVVIAADAHERLLLGAVTPDIKRRDLSLMKRLGSWLSTVHQQQIPYEREEWPQ